MGQSRTSLDFDGSPKALLHGAIALAEDHHIARNSQFERDYLQYLAYKDLMDINPDLPHISLPKMLSICEQKAPADTDALFGRRPVFPFTSKRKEFKRVAEIQTAVYDDLMAKAGIYVEGATLVKMKILYGTSYMNQLPYYESVTEKKMVRDSLGGVRVKTTTAPRLRLKLETWAPWEVYVDPYAKNLRDYDGCRYIIKVQLCSKRMIKELYAKGAYPQLDLDKLDAHKGTSSRHRGDHWGLKMLASYGLSVPADDDDMGLLFRYESPDRYVDSWMGETTLRDGPNPWKHKRINLSKITHIRLPHTQEQFYGMGEAKINEVQCAMLDDLWAMTFGAHGMLGQPMIFYRKGAVKKRDLIFGLAQRIPVAGDTNRKIQDDVMIHSGDGLPTSHYILPDKVERNIDLAAGQFGPGRGELSGQENTATEVLETADQGDKRQEQSIKLGEHEFGIDFSGKGTSIVEQFGNLEDYIESVGEEDALNLITANPADLPGGHNMDFKGSGMVAQVFRKQRAIVAVAPLVQESGVARPGGVARKALQLFEFDTDEVEDMMLNQEEIEIMQQQQALIALAGIGLQSEEQKQIQQDKGGKNGKKTTA